MKYSSFPEFSVSGTKEDVEETVVSYCLSKTSRGKKNTDENMETRDCFILDYHRMNQWVSSVKLIVIIGLMLALPILNFVNPRVNETKTLVNQNNDIQNCQSVEKVTARLARVMNAIFLQKEWQQESVTMKKVMAEVLDVQDASLFDYINETSVLDITKNIKLLDSLAVETIKINGTITDLTEFLFYDEKSVPNASISEMLFSRRISSLDVSSHINRVGKVITDYEDFMKELKMPVKGVPWLVIVFGNTISKIYHLSKPLSNESNFNVIEHFVNSSENVNSLIYYIEKYQQLTDHSYLRKLNKNLEILLPSFSFVDSFLKNFDIKIFTEQLDAVNRLIRTNTKVSDMYALIGFPQKSKDFQNLMDDFSDEFLKKMLHGGKSLKELKNLLLPVHNFKTKLADTEKLWAKTTRVNYSNSIFSCLTTLKKIRMLKPMSLSILLSEVKATLQKIKLNPKLTHSDLNEFKQFLYNLSNSSIEWKKFSDLREKSYSLWLHLGLFESEVLKLSNEDIIVELKKNFLKDEYTPIIYSLKEKTELFVKQKDNVENLFSKMGNFKEKFTDKTFDHIHKLIKRTHKKIMKLVQNYVLLLNSLTRLTEIELSAIDNLPKFLLSAKTKMDESGKFEQDVKAEIKRTEGYHRLENFPYVRAITVQLASSWRAMVFYQRRDLQQIFNDFVTNFKVLAEKINSLPIAEKQYISSGFYKLSSLNISITNLTSEAQKLPSKLIIKKQSLKSFGETISAFYNDQLPLLDFDLITTTLYDLKLTSIGRSQEVYNVKQSFEKLDGLQHATILNKLALVPLLAQADAFFQEFFYLESKKETRILLPIVITVFALLLVIVLILLILWQKTTRTKKSLVKKGENNEHKLET